MGTTIREGIPLAGMQGPTPFKNQDIQQLLCLTSYSFCNNTSPLL
jgi:hypothetical protein